MAEPSNQITCKQCGTPLPSTWKYKYCEDCRRDRAEAKRNVAVGVISMCVSVGVIAKDKIAHAAKIAAPHIMDAVKTATNHLRK